MSLPITIQSPESGLTAKVVNGGSLLVANQIEPPLHPQMMRVYSRKFTDDGLTSGTSELGVNGSVTAVEYWIPASADNDIYISTLSFLLGYGSSAEMYEFADSGGALTNGIKVSYIETDGTETTIMNPKANYSLMRSSLGSISNSEWESRGFAASGDYGYYSNVPLSQMTPPFGVKLDKGSTQRISILIRDNCADADLFNCNAFGFERFE
jgi:hypothetical protein